VRKVRKVVSAMKRNDAIRLVEAELTRAGRLHGAMNSLHEGLSVVEEEMCELRSSVYWPGRNQKEPRTEAIQLAAMAIRFLCDLC